MIEFGKIRFLARPTAVFAAALLALVCAAVVGPGCSSNSTTAGTDCNSVTIVAGDDCANLCEQQGGVVEEGVCVPKCIDADCVSGNVCVNNRCELECATYKDCIVGQQDCLAATQDSTQMPIFTCQSSQKLGFGSACPFGTECAALTACSNGDQCNFTQCGGGTCTQDPVACIGVDKCNFGKCDTGEACTVPACDQSDCRPLVCIGAGQGDANAYCSFQDCHADTDCASSFYCGITRDPNPICNSDPTMEVGGSPFCGATDAMMMNPTCVDPTTFMQGNTYVEGSVCLLRSTCLQRRACDPCENDAECGNIDGGVCKMIGTDMRCTAPCSVDTDCQSDNQCTGGFCIPRFGACVGTGGFCEPCVSDEDCGMAGSTQACVSLSTGQRACFDVSLSMTCTTDDDCPTSPSGKHGACLNETEEVAPSDSVYHHCYLPFDPNTLRFACW
jgi:hypothetical protein